MTKTFALLHRLRRFRNITMADFKLTLPAVQLKYRLVDTLKLDVVTLAAVASVVYAFFLEDWSRFDLFLVLVPFVAGAIRVVTQYRQANLRYDALVQGMLFEKSVDRNCAVLNSLLESAREQVFVLLGIRFF